MASSPTTSETHRSPSLLRNRGEQDAPSRSLVPAARPCLSKHVQVHAECDRRSLSVQGEQTVEDEESQRGRRDASRHLQEGTSALPEGVPCRQRHRVQSRRSEADEDTRRKGSLCDDKIPPQLHRLCRAF